MRAASEAGPGWAWAATAQLAVLGHRNKLRHAGGFSPMLTDVQTHPDGAGLKPCEFPNTIEKNKPDKSCEISHLIFKNRKQS